MAVGYPLRLALRVALSLAQIGEFSFIVGNLALHNKLLPDEAMHVLVAASIFTISFAPLLQFLVDPITRFVQSLAMAASTNHHATTIFVGTGSLVG